MGIVGKEQLNFLITKLNKIKQQLEYELPEFWWLSQGEEAIISVRVLQKKKELMEYPTPRITIKSAITKVIKNIELANMLKGKDYVKAIKIIEEDIANIAETYSILKEAHNLVREIENLKKILEQKDIHVKIKEELKADLNRTIKWIHDLFVSSPREFLSRKDTIETLISKIKEKIESTT